MKGAALFLFLIGAVGCVSDTPDSRGKILPDLAPCPDSPNCVSTKSKDSRHGMPPLPYLGSGQDSLDRLVRIVQGMKRSRIIAATPSYLQVEFRSTFFRFVDDAEFVLDDSARVIHFRSASRTGYYDFGVNRRRMEEISNRYLHRTQKVSGQETIRENQAIQSP